MRGVRNNLVGRRFGLLTVIGEMPPPSCARRGSGGWWTCKCDCGKTCLREGHGLTRTQGEAATWVHSCGCRTEGARAIGRKVNRDPLARYGTRKQRKAQEAASVFACNEQLLRQLEEMEE
jgi:hypothetical protein